MSHAGQTPQQPSHRFTHLRERLARVLPGQAPLRDFVHHNTLHGFQHLPFPQALKHMHELTGVYGYWSAERFREQFQCGRIREADLDAVLQADSTLEASAVIFTHAEGVVTRGDVYRTALIHPIKAISPSQFVWQVEENQVLEHFGALWAGCLEALGLQHYLWHSEELMMFSPERAVRLFAAELAQTADTSMEARLMHDAQQLLLDWLGQIGTRHTMRSLLLAVTGEDIMHSMRPLLLRQMGAWLDQGVAAWTNAESIPHLFAAWRETSLHDLTPFLEDLPDWREHLTALPDDPAAVIIAELQRLGISEARWDDYLVRLALEMPGWSGMFLWREQHPQYGGKRAAAVSMLDYLALRLVLERLFARRLCQRIWSLEANIDVIRGRFWRHWAEFLVRYSVFQQSLPEYLLTPAQHLIRHTRPGVYEDPQWEQLAHQMWTWVKMGNGSVNGAYHHGWRLFCLMRHLQVDAATVSTLSQEQLASIFACLDTLDEERAGFLWLQAYERHYHEQIFSVLTLNHGRGSGYTREQRPQAQVVFCMDEREEGIRRHLEELNPHIETLGAAAFFNLPINWQGLDDKEVSKLCPVPVTPVHLVREIPDITDDDWVLHQHQLRVSWRKRLFAYVQHVTRHNLLLGTLIQWLLAPVSLGIMLGKSYLPLGFGRWVKSLRRKVDKPIPTTLEYTAWQIDSERSGTQNQTGFTDAEQADRVGGFLRMIGLTDGFAPLVVIMGHGSTSQNNPHAAAYECGACSGRHSGPNARVFAAMANRLEVRALLAKQGLLIPPETWFVGAEHDTCDEHLVWFDTHKVPAAWQPALQALQTLLEEAARYSAHERCRKLASAPRHPSLEQAAAHIAGRAMDYSQARPELGHATNAWALIGRRAVTRGSFLDRRCFLISYDCTRDPDGKVLESILLSAAPVGAGINLEYYFSSVNNERYGAGTKITHNLTGLFGVMEGVFSDLRTGLPQQMIEIHEPMRLLVVVEAKTALVEAIYARQPPLQELIGGGWLLLAVKDPDSATIDRFVPGTGFTRWEGDVIELATVERSAQWYSGKYGHLPPALVTASAVTREVSHA